MKQISVGFFSLLFLMQVDTSAQSNLLFLLQVSENMDILCLCRKKGQYFVHFTWFSLTKARTDAFQRDHEGLDMCVCSQTSEAEKSINPCIKEYRNYGFMSVQQE
jgi:hypothetical protein